MARVNQTAPPLPPVPIGERIEGTIVRIFPEKKFGFAEDQYQREYFIHANTCEQSSVWATLARGSQVSFIVETSAKGLRGLFTRLVS